MFAGDVHDLVGSRLWLAALRSELAHRTAAEGSPMRAELAEVVELVHKAAADIRDIARAYREITLRTEMSNGRAVLEAYGIDCRVKAPAVTLPPAVDKVLAVVVREAVTNVLRHSKATVCRIELDPAGEGVRLVVSNDGLNPDPEASSGGRGLAGLRRRASSVGGTVEIAAERSGWFRLTTVIPDRRP